MKRRQPISTRNDTLVHNTTLFRSGHGKRGGGRGCRYCWRQLLLRSLCRIYAPAGRGDATQGDGRRSSDAGRDHPSRRSCGAEADRRARHIRCRDRKSVVSGKSVSVRVDLGGRRIITKKKEKKRI